MSVLWLFKQSIHLEAHRFQDEAKKMGLTDKRLIKFILKKMYTRESFIGTFTRGGLSHKNLILSLLAWSGD